jgi:hypothetical protein
VQGVDLEQPLSKRQELLFRSRVRQAGGRGAERAANVVCHR